MRSAWRGIFQTIVLAAVVFLLVRFFPIFIQMMEAAALGIRTFWWLILILALGGWLIWMLRNRNSG